MKMATRRKKRRWTSAAARRIIAHSGCASVEDAVEVTASRLLHGVPCPPTDLKVLMGRLGVTGLEGKRRLPISGELRKHDAGLVIVYSATLSPARRRFTIAHELGHAVFEKTGRNCPRHGRELERICDLLAAEFLMPRTVFLARTGDDLRPGQVLGLARDFGTSIMATALRCQQLVRASVFHVEEGRVSWGYGVVRGQRDLQSDARGFGDAIGRAMEGASGEEAVFAGQRPARLEWVCLQGGRRALFVLKQERLRR